MKKNAKLAIWLVGAVVIAALIVAAMITSTAKNETVATVDGSKITKEELYDELVASYGTDTLNTLITNKMIELEVKKQNVTVSDEDIQKELDQEHQGTVRKWWMESYQDPIASIFEKGIKEQKLRDPAEIGSDPVSSAYLLLSLISSRNTDYKLKESLAKEQARLYVKVILYGLSATKE